ncbi:MAG: DUF2207 domain-containing protein [Bacillota bacterium]|nr:DUF2207 domain-containing protein [Bacillota bacterium]
MKYSLKILFPCLFFILFILSSSSVQAQSSKLSIGKYLITSEILNSGDMSVEEVIHYNFSGNFNGVKRQILFPGGCSIQNVKISEGSKIYKQVDSASNGDMGVFRLDTSVNNALTIWIYAPSTDMSRIITISYTIKNAAIKYNDTGEIYWRFLGNENKAPVDSLSISIKLPLGSTKSTVKFFTHGPLNISSKMVDNQTVSLYTNDLAAEKYVEARVLFPPNLIAAAQRNKPINELNDILKQESSVKNSVIENLRNFQQIESSIIIFAVFAVIVQLFVKFKLCGHAKSKFRGKYLESLPSDCSPAVMSVLCKSGKITSKDICATLIDLVRKKYFKLEIIPNSSYSISNVSNKHDFVITRICFGDSNSLNHEKFFMNWFMRCFGYDGAFTFNEIKQTVRDIDFALEFRENFREWVDIVKNDAAEYGYFENKSPIVGTVVSVMFIIISLLIACYITKINGSLITKLLCLIIIVLSASLIGGGKRRTQKGSTERAKWKAFKNYLMDFSTLRNVAIPSIITWESYLPFAISLGIAQKAIHQLKTFFPNKCFKGDANIADFTYINILADYDTNITFDQFNDITNTFDQILTIAFSPTSSSDLSSGGEGGDSGDSSDSGGGDGGGGSDGF